MTKEDLFEKIEDISILHPQGIPGFIANEFPTQITSLLDEGKIIKMESPHISGPAGEYYILPENEQACEKSLNLRKA